MVGPYFEFQDLRFFLLAFACPRVPRAHHLARRATHLLSITNRPPPPLSFSCFTLGDLRLRPGIVPTLTLTFNKPARALPFFEPAFYSCTPVSLGSIFATDLAHRQLADSPCHSNALTPIPPARQRSAPHTPSLLARAPGSSPLLALIHLPRSTFLSGTFNCSVLFGIHPLAGHHRRRGSNDGRLRGGGYFRYT